MTKYLGTKGLTSSEANYTANIVKELCEKTAQEIKQMTLFKGVIHFQGKENDYNKVYKVDNLQEKCMQEGNLYALSAWLREAIKSKDSLVTKNISNNFEKELKQLPIAPKLVNSSTEEEIKNGLPIDELAEFLMYEAKAAHLGKKVHPGGIFETWFNLIKNIPRTQINPDNKDYVVFFEQEVNESSLYEIFFSLQKEYREAEQKVNYYKSKVKDLLNQKSQEINAVNQKALNEYKNECNEIYIYNAIVQEEIETLRGQKLKEIAELKIIIPFSLQATLDYVQTFSKK